MKEHKNCNCFRCIGTLTASIADRLLEQFDAGKLDQFTAATLNRLLSEAK